MNSFIIKFNFLTKVEVYSEEYIAKYGSKPSIG